MNKYLIFDERNNLIEECEYGERFAVTKIRDSIVMISHYNDFLKKNRITINKYDSLNRTILEETCRYKNNIKSKAYSKYQYLYDDVYNKIKRIDIDNDTIFYSSIKKTDTLYNINGQKFRLENEDTIFYNQLGHPIFKNEYYKGELNSKREYFYNEKDKLIKEIKSDNLSSLEPEIIIYKYNTIDSIVSVVSSRKYSLNGNYYYSYFKNGKLKRIKNYYKNLPHRTFSYKYKKINN